MAIAIENRIDPDYVFWCVLIVCGLIIVVGGK